MTVVEKYYLLKMIRESHYSETSIDGKHAVRINFPTEYDAAIISNLLINDGVAYSVFENHMPFCIDDIYIMETPNFVLIDKKKLLVHDVYLITED